MKLSREFVLKILMFGAKCARVSRRGPSGLAGQRESQHTPAQRVLSEALEGRRGRRADVQLVVQQVRVPRQAPGAGQRGVGQPSVVSAPVVVALGLGVCRTHTHTHNQTTRVSTC